MEHCGTWTLETARLLLRRFTLDDAAAMYLGIRPGSDEVHDVACA